MSRKRYRFKYKVDNDDKVHYRYYSALDEGTASSMFEETCRNGSLTGSSVHVIDVSKSNKKGKWKKVKA